MGEHRESAGDQSGSGGGGSQNGPVTGRGNGSGGGGAPQSANSSENRGRFSHATYNGPGAFGQGGFSAGDEERKPRDYGSEFTPNPNAGGTGLMASMTACGPIHLGSVGDKHKFGTDADGNPIERSDLECLAAANGLQPVSSVTKKSCDLLVAADPESASGKTQKARKYGVPVMSVEMFLKGVGA